MRIKNFLTTAFALTFILALTGSLQAKRFAVVLGSNYTNNTAGIPELELCETDARLMEQSLKANGRFDEAKVLLGQMVTATNVQASFADLATKVTPNDNVVVYFSGHGTYQRDAAAPNGLRNYIVMYTRPHVSDKDLDTWMKGIKSPHVTLIMDACFSGGIAKKGRRGAGEVPTSPGADGTVIQNGDDNFYFQNKAIIGSSDSNETSIEVRGNINHGVFTYWFAQGLEPGKGDLNGDGTVTALEAFEWSAKRVTDMAKNQFQHDQHPQISGNAKGIALAGKDLVVVQPNQPNKPEPTKPEPTKPEPTKPEPTKPEPTKPEPTKPEPTNTVTDPNDEPDPNPNKVGNITLATTILRSTLSFPQTGDPMLTMRQMRGKDEDRKIKVYFSDKEVPFNLRWVDQAGMKAISGEDIPMGTYTVGKGANPVVKQNQVAVIEVSNVPAGIHDVKIVVDDYPAIKETVGVEQGSPCKKFIVASLKGTGSIQGKVFLKNVETPLAGQPVWMPTVTATNQVHKMKTLSDGSFWFLNLPPSRYYTLKASFKETVKLDNQTIVIKDGDVTKVDVILQSP